MIGYAIPSLESQPVPASTRLETSKVLQPPEAFKTLDGFVEMFLGKVTLASGHGLWAGGGGDELDGSGDGLGSSASGTRPKLVVNAEHSWMYEIQQHDWAVAPTEWRASQVSQAWRAQDWACGAQLRDQQARVLHILLSTLSPPFNRPLNPAGQGFRV